MAARAGFQSVTPSGGGGGAAAGAGALGPGAPGGPVRMGPAPGQGLYRSPLPGAAYPRPGMLPGSRLAPQGPSMGPPGYGGSPAVRPGMAQAGLDQARKRPAPQQLQQVQPQAVPNRNHKHPRASTGNPEHPQTSPSIPHYPWTSPEHPWASPSIPRSSLGIPEHLLIIPKHPRTSSDIPELPLTSLSILKHP